ncbi:MAG: hypothetical protein RIB78_03905 [Gammaproteobacteria bacterium]
METKKSLFSLIGIGLGSLALLMALFHFYAGPLSPQPAIEDTVAEKAVAIRDATIAALKGEEKEKKVVTVSNIDLDKVVSIATAMLGGLAIILGVIGFVRHEPLRAATGAAVLGGTAIAFQFLVVALGLIVGVILIAVILSQLGFDI